MKQFKILLLACLTFGLMSAHAVTTDSVEKIYQRTAPVGQVSTGGDSAAADTSASSARSGEDIYNATCHTCHGTGLLDAPKKGDAAAWDARYAAGADTVLKHAINGLNAMPPRGTCGDCSDDEILAAIKFMSGH